MIHVELTWLLPLYSCLGFEAKRLIGEPCKRGADGEEFAPGRRGLTIHEGPGPRTMPEDIEDQPDAWPDDKVFPIAGQAEPKAPKSNSLSRPWKEVPLCFHRHWSSQWHCSRRAAQPPGGHRFSVLSFQAHSVQAVRRADDDRPRPAQQNRQALLLHWRMEAADDRHPARAPLLRQVVHLQVCLFGEHLGQRG